MCKQHQTTPRHVSSALQIICPLRTSTSICFLVQRTVLCNANSTPDALQVLPQTEKIMARLKRLDEVLPKYQGIAGQLYELLKVKGLDDIVPAVNKLVS